MKASTIWTISIFALILAIGAFASLYKVDVLTTASQDTYLTAKADTSRTTVEDVLSKALTEKIQSDMQSETDAKAQAEKTELMNKIVPILQNDLARKELLDSVNAISGKYGLNH